MQPDPQGGCSQASVATLLGMTFDDVLAVLTPLRAGTYTIRRTLRELGCTVGRRFKPAPVATGLARVTRYEESGKPFALRHVVAVIEGHVFDPLWGVDPDFASEGKRVTSYLSVELPC